ncbi:MAG: ribokinase, partial [Oscillospiraceae bacterium]
FVYSVDHFVKPGETLSSLNLEKFSGGKGLNQSIALAKAGAEIYHFGKIGEDGLFLKEQLQNAGVNTKYLKISDIPSGHAIIQVDKNGQNCILLFGGANKSFTKEEIIKVIDDFDKNYIILIQNEINLLDFIVEYAHEKGLKIALNPSPINDELMKIDFNKIDYFILNEIEGAQIGDVIINEDEKGEKCANSILNKFPKSKIVLTLGKNGVIYKDSKNTFSHGIYDVCVKDTTAAGDTFTGFFLGCISKGKDIKTALQLASIASSIAVSKMGAACSIPSLADVLNSTIKLK